MRKLPITKQASWSRLVALVSVLLCSPCWLHGAPQNGGDFSNNPGVKKLPPDVLFVKGAWSSASDSTTPVPENGAMANNTYSNKYFRLTYAPQVFWTQKYSGPPPSDSGYYVLAQMRITDSGKNVNGGSVLIGAQDLFFTPWPATNALELINYRKDNLGADYKIDQPPTLVRIGDHSFVRFAYSSPRAELHWQVLATQIRCHMVQFIFTGRDAKMIEGLVEQMSGMKLPAEAGPISGTGGGDVPVCIKGYAREENILERVDPVFTVQRFNSIPVRILIDSAGNVKHIHFLSAFPDQAKAITDALMQWKFRPGLKDGHPVWVETGMVFGRGAYPIAPSLKAGTQ